MAHTILALLLEIVLFGWLLFSYLSNPTGGGQYSKVIFRLLSFHTNKQCLKRCVCCGTDLSSLVFV